ncbi:hypothetical protein GCM10023329_17990 [Streptomyces sanyensis]|uniref:Secreted protein n=1 Tax=Streptomyces sanyensis TaxID=568869 RepID=A0ABP9A207_9ACTN
MAASTAGLAAIGYAGALPATAVTAVTDVRRTPGRSPRPVLLRMEISECPCAARKVRACRKRTSTRVRKRRFRRWETVRMVVGRVRCGEGAGAPGVRAGRARPRAGRRES